MYTLSQLIERYSMVLSDHFDLEELKVASLECCPCVAKAVVEVLQREAAMPTEALKALWEASGRSREKCMEKVKDEKFLRVRKGETREQAAARFCNWLEQRMEK